MIFNNTSSVLRARLLATVIEKRHLHIPFLFFGIVLREQKSAVAKNLYSIGINGGNINIFFWYNLLQKHKAN